MVLIGRHCYGRADARSRAPQILQGRSEVTGRSVRSSGVIAADVTRQPQDAALAVAIAADSPADEHRLHQVLSVTGRCTVHRLAAPGDDLGNRRGLPADGADVIVL